MTKEELLDYVSIKLMANQFNNLDVRIEVGDDSKEDRLVTTITTDSGIIAESSQYLVNALHDPDNYVMIASWAATLDDLGDPE